jgi:aminodeoxyfutalosine synthase
VETVTAPTSIEDLAAKIEAGIRLVEEEARLLESGRDLVTLGMIADAARRKRHGNNVTFVRVADIPVAAGASVAQGFNPVEGGNIRPSQIPGSAGEARIVGKPASLAEAVGAVSAVRALAGPVPVSAFSLAELEALPGSLSDALSAIKGAGLELIAEAPVDALKSPERALESAAAAGLSVARLTVQQAGTDLWAICNRVVALQERFSSFRAFAPLSRVISPGQPTTGYEDVKRVALARLLVDNVPSIQVDWSLYGPKLAQVALTFGADDLDAVSAIDDESQGHRRSPLEEIRRSIQAAWLTPVERNARFQRIDRM